MILLSHLEKNLINVGSGDECPFFTWTDFDEEDIFYMFPGTRYFAVFISYDKKIEFFKIVNCKSKIPKDCIKVIEKISYDSLKGTSRFDAYFCQVSSYEIIEKFGKKHKYLLYELDLL